MQRSLPLAISPSRCELATRCERRHFVKDVLGLEREDATSQHRDFGTALHAGAAAWWRTGNELRAQAVLRETWAPTIPAQSGGKLTLDLAEFMLRYYCAQARMGAEHWAADAEGWELVACEERVEMELGNGSRLRFQLDRLVRNTQCDPAQYVLVDLKTASRLSHWWLRGWPSALQQKLYAAAVRDQYGVPAEQFSHYIEGLLKSAPSDLRYVELRWPSEVLDEAMDLAAELVARDTVYFKLAQHWNDAESEWELDEEELREVGVTATQTNGDDCWAYNRQCELYELCHYQPPAARAAVLAEQFVEGEEDWLD